MQTVDDLMREQIRQLYHAENQFIEILGFLSRLTVSSSLRESLLTYRAQAETHIERLNRMAEIEHFSLKDEVSPCSTQSLHEAAKSIRLAGTPSVINLAIAITVRQLQQIQLASYQATDEIAQYLQRNTVKQLLKKTIIEQQESGEHLVFLSERVLLPDASEARSH